ncbi:META domain-containing protein [Aeromonas crassostreae]
MNKNLMLLAALALGGCAMTSGSNTAQLQAHPWQLQGADGDGFTLQVAEGKVAGKGGCNRYFGGITQLDEQTLTLTGMGATRMMCPGDLMAKEGDYFQKLSQVASYQVSANQLVLKDASQAILLTFEAKPAQ